MCASALVAAMILGCSGASGDPQDELLVFTDWIRIDALCGYSFRAPPELTELSAFGLDSCVQSWLTRSCEYGADYSIYSSDLFELRESEQYEELREVIGGRDAKLVIAVRDGERPYVAAVTLPEVDPDAPGVRFTLVARCNSAAAQQDALSVLRSITFSS